MLSIRKKKKKSGKFVWLVIQATPRFKWLKFFKKETVVYKSPTEKGAQHFINKKG